MKISDKTIAYIAKVITGDSNETPYRSGAELVVFFNELGFSDEYGLSFPSRGVFAENKLKEINGTETMRLAIEKIFDPRDFLGTNFDLNNVINQINEYLVFDDYKLVKVGRFYRVTRDEDDKVTLSNSLPSKHAFVIEQLSKCDEKINTADYDGAITSARSLMEGVFGDIYQRVTGVDLPASGNLLDDYKKIKDFLNLSDEKYSSDSIKQILRGLASIIDGIEKISNKMGDRHRRSVDPKKFHAKLCVNSTKTIADFLYELLDQQYSSSGDLLTQLIGEIDGEKRFLSKEKLLVDPKIKTVLNRIDDYIARLFIEKLISDFSITGFRRSDIFFSVLGLFQDKLTRNDVKEIFAKHKLNNQAVGLYNFVKVLGIEKQSLVSDEFYKKYLDENKEQYE